MDTQDYIYETEAPSKGKSIAALILGICSIAFNTVLSCLPLNWIISLVTAIVSKVLLKNIPDSGLKTGAKITSTIGLILSIVRAAIVVLVVGAYLVLYILTLVGALSMAGLSTGF